jgi:hypothetical protein
LGVGAPRRKSLQGSLWLPPQKTRWPPCSPQNNYPAFPCPGQTEAVRKGKDSLAQLCPQPLGTLRKSQVSKNLSFFTTKMEPRCLQLPKWIQGSSTQVGGKPADLSRAMHERCMVSLPAGPGRKGARPHIDTQILPEVRPLLIEPDLGTARFLLSPLQEQGETPHCKGSPSCP